VSAEGYNHILGFYESSDGGKTWPVQGHIPGYEGWTDNTDPVGAFDGFGNYYELILPYQFFNNADGSHNFTVGTSQEPNPAQPAEVISVSVRPHGATKATDWKTTVNGSPDIIAAYDSVGREPDKQWITIDTNPASPHYNRVYAMWVVFHGPFTPTPFVSYADARADGTHTAWSAPIPLPTPPHTPQGATYLLPHVDPGGVVYTTITNEDPAHQSFATTISVDRSTDGGKTWSVVSTPVNNAALPPLIYPNTTFRDGITDTFAVGNHLDAQGRYPLYIAYEDYSAGIGNVLLTASYDGGETFLPSVAVSNAGRDPLKSPKFPLEVFVTGGVKIDLDSAAVGRCIRDAGIGFMFAPAHHPAMKNVGPTRVELGTRTIFNLLGPLSNPASVKKQMIGTFSRHWIEPMAQVLNNLGSESIWVVHGSDGLDEITTAGPTAVAELKGGKVRTFEISPEDAGLKKSKPDALRGGDAEHNAKALLAALQGKDGAFRDVAVLNAAAAFVVAGKAKDLKEGAALAAKSIESGEAEGRLDRLIAVSNATPEE